MSILVAPDRVSNFQVPLSSPAETHARHVFMQLMWALSYPGRIQTLADHPADTPVHMLVHAMTTPTKKSFIRIAQTLLDLETSFFTPDMSLAGALLRTGARQLDATNAAYHFYLSATTDTQPSALLTHVRGAALGTLLYPDQAATLIIGCRLGRGVTLRLHGPGIQGEATLRVAGLPLDFWHVRAERVIYPLGWDLFLVDGLQVVGLPRTTTVEIIDAQDALERTLESEA